MKDRQDISHARCVTDDEAECDLVETPGCGRHHRGGSCTLRWERINPESVLR